MCGTYLIKGTICTPEAERKLSIHAMIKNDKLPIHGAIFGGTHKDVARVWIAMHEPVDVDHTCKSCCRMKNDKRN